MAKWEFTYIMQQRLCSGRSNKDSAEITNNIHEHAIRVERSPCRVGWGCGGSSGKKQQGVSACEKCQVIIAMLGFSSDMTRAVLMSQ